ncbi:Uncharacterised protein [Serratia rubidaea]|uniref:Uncharacterized protein n=1 Tax=Serratia rubidaea TaxID=61652 RepID=A0A3S4FVU0_SERRU|nr:Uncharacterised protein [Serratia rubidaea]
MLEFEGQIIDTDAQGYLKNSATGMKAWRRC